MLGLLLRTRLWRDPRSLTLVPVAILAQAILAQAIGPGSRRGAAMAAPCGDRLGASPLCREALLGPVAQAVDGVVAAACTFGATRKDTACWVAAAARGATLGSAAQASSQREPLSVLQGLLHMLGVANVKAAVATLRQ